MGDLLDRAQAISELQLNTAIGNARSALPNRELQVNGRCHYCGEYLENPMALFCQNENAELESECASDWHYEQLAKIRKEGRK